MCTLSPDMGLWRTPEVPDWILASRLWFWYGQEPCFDLFWSFQYAQISNS